MFEFRLIGLPNRWQTLGYYQLLRSTTDTGHIPMLQISLPPAGMQDSARAFLTAQSSIRGYAHNEDGTPSFRNTAGHVYATHLHRKLAHWIHSQPDKPLLERSDQGYFVGGAMKRMYSTTSDLPTSSVDLSPLFLIYFTGLYNINN